VLIRHERKPGLIRGLAPFRPFSPSSAHSLALTFVLILPDPVSGTGVPEGDGGAAFGTVFAYSTEEEICKQYDQVAANFGEHFAKASALCRARRRTTEPYTE
jgi:hypothetical protein